MYVPENLKREIDFYRFSYEFGSRLKYFSRRKIYGTHSRIKVYDSAVRDKSVRAAA